MNDTSKRYRIVSAGDLQSGDIIKTTRCRVDSIEHVARIGGSLPKVCVRFTNGRHGVLHSTHRMGIYR